MGNEWLINESSYNPEKELLMETLFALSNGYMSCRGTLEESLHYPDIRQYPGTYAAGIFDKYNKDYQAIVNLPNLFNTPVSIGKEPLHLVKSKITNYQRDLDMHNGTIIRKFTWANAKNEKLNFIITRFISKSDPHLAVLHYSMNSESYTGDISFENIIDANISNIDFHISGYQLRDEKYFFIDKEHEKSLLNNGGYLQLKTKTNQQKVAQGFKIQISENGKPLSIKFHSVLKDRYLNLKTNLKIKKGHQYDFFKVIALYTSNDHEPDLKKAVEKTLNTSLDTGYERLYKDHCQTWNAIWDSSDIKISGNEIDQRNIRFNLFHVIQMGNKNNPYVNIGSRGLTSEMHYGNCFWDTELFIMPFFIYTDPDTAKALVQYRYLTLPEAKNKAKQLWFQGAMFPWMSSYPGKEQADYWEYANIAIHIVSDVACGLMHYYHITGDEQFMMGSGLEILIETAKFQTSRVYFNPRINKYVMNVVKGPNEYDGVVNNNTYTNWGSRWNLMKAIEMIQKAQKEYPEKLKEISQKTDFQISELTQWQDIVDKMYINYDATADLFIEDDTFLDKKPGDLKKFRPGKKISTEMGWTWDTIISHRVVKQADVLLLMTIHRNYFTLQQLKNAWNFYEPLTLHDSSLSYNTHAIVGAELGLKDKSYDYYQQTVRLDIDDLMENSFLGIHSANAGGSWQCVVNGFCGMKTTDTGLEFDSRLPDAWKQVQFKIIFQGVQFEITADQKGIHIEKIRDIAPTKGTLKIDGNKIIKL